MRITYNIYIYFCFFLHSRRTGLDSPLVRIHTIALQAGPPSAKLCVSAWQEEKGECFFRESGTTGLPGYISHQGPEVTSGQPDTPTTLHLCAQV